LQGLDLTNDDMSNSNLKGAILRDSYLNYANYQEANLCGADFQEQTFFLLI